MTGLAAARRAAIAMLDAAGIDHPARDVSRLLRDGLGLSPEDMIADPDRALSDADIRQLDTLIARRARHEPVSRIIGRRDFYGRTFGISPDVLDPRPDSELIIDEALKLMRDDTLLPPAPHIVDLGTGSGCLAITLLAELPGARATAIDISGAACSVARQNAERLGVSDRLMLIEGDAFGMNGVMIEAADLVVSNPPYISAADLKSLPPDVANFDPVGALDGGVDGLSFYRLLTTRLPSLLGNGAAILEIGHDQSEPVTSLFRATDPKNEWIADLCTAKDLNARDRCVVIRTQTNAVAGRNRKKMG